MSNSEIVNSNKMERERAEFRTLLPSNPNYFGTVEESGFDEVESIQQNTKGG